MPMLLISFNRNAQLWTPICGGNSAENWHSKLHRDQIHYELLTNNITPLSNLQSVKRSNS